MENREDNVREGSSKCTSRHDILARLRALWVMGPLYRVQNVNELYQQELKRGDRVAIWVAEAVLSWKFIIGQSVVLAGWVTLNVMGWIKNWDPYPFRSIYSSL